MRSEPRTETLTDHAEYFLDGALEENEIDACSYLTLRLFGNRDAIQGITDSGDLTFRGLAERRARAGRLVMLAESTLLGVDEETVGGLVYRGLAELPKRLHDLACFYADWALTDETEGGAALPFRKRPRLTPDGSPTKGVTRRVCAPSWVRRYIKKMDETVTFRNLVQRQFARAAAVPESCLKDSHAEIEAAFHRQYEIERVRRDREFLANLARPADRPCLTRQDRKVAKRAAATAVSILGPAAVSDFAKGLPVAIAGTELAFIAQRRLPVHSTGHGAMAVDVETSTGARLGKLCVYFEDTPALDQLSALALHVHAGLEADIIERANIISATDAGWAHPLIATKRAPARDENAPPLFRNQSRYDQDRARKRAYWRQSRSLWIGIIAEQATNNRAERGLLSRAISMDSDGWWK